MVNFDDCIELTAAWKQAYNIFEKKAFVPAPAPAPPVTEQMAAEEQQMMQQQEAAAAQAQQDPNAQQAQQAPQDPNAQAQGPAIDQMLQSLAQATEQLAGNMQNMDKKLEALSQKSLKTETAVTKLMDSMQLPGEVLDTTPINPPAGTTPQM